MKIFDADIAYGRAAIALPKDIETVDDVLAEMSHCGIAEALVWHRDARERDFALGNARVTRDAVDPRCHPVWTFVPTCCREMPDAATFVDQVKAAGVRAVRAFPLVHCFRVDRVSCGDLLEAFIAHHLPVFLPLTELPGQWHDVYTLLRDFPQLTLVLAQTGCWGQDRYFRPLMSAYPGFHITMDRLETAGQLKSIVDAVGPDHVVFGSGLPRNYPGAYILSLVRANIPDGAREAIAHGTIERLLGEVPW
ncbi:MAG TPA: amidohydrolase family protein [Candidatus Hydrogenedentes bacterium]|nr:amidohydrolase family protein [Candidatus Hydrogenedentota bacterium]HPG69935.1 amidohydrolase family protein [Candidatus Hydrogenedentota bacterium]